MLNTFPQLLVFGFFAPTLLRIAAAVTLFYIAAGQIGRRGQIDKLRFPLVGRGAWVPWVSAVAHGILGALILVGLYTQIAAIIALIVTIKNFFLAPRYPALVPLSRGTLVLLFVILLSLLISGAGALAFDLPL